MSKSPQSLEPANIEDSVIQVLIVGAGRLGVSIARLLSSHPSYNVRLIDPNYEKVKIAVDLGFEAHEASGSDKRAMQRFLSDTTTVVVAAPESIAVRVAQFADDHGCDYFDLCEDVDASIAIEQVAKSSRQAFVSHCGLAPGYVSVLVYEKIQKLDAQAKINAYVGVLPETKSNRLGFGNIWDIRGLITEYTKPCNVIIDGEPHKIGSRTKYETLDIEGTTYEAFTTAGTLDDVVKCSGGKIGALVFKTLRYRGHLDYINFLLDDLGLKDRIYTFRNLLQTGLPIVKEDKVVIHLVTETTDATGIHEDRQTQIFHSRLEGDGSRTSAISVASAAHVCSVLDVVCNTKPKSVGFLDHTKISLSELAQSKFFSELNDQI